MSDATAPEKITQARQFRPGHGPTRDKAGCRAILDYFRSLPRNLSDRECPSSLELIRDGRFGQRPVNRINDLVLGKFDGHCYDFERINRGREEYSRHVRVVRKICVSAVTRYRWRLHWPNRPGCPKDKRYEVISWNERPRVKTDNYGRPLPPESSIGPLFTEARR